MDEEWSIGGPAAEPNGTLLNGWLSANNAGAPNTIDIVDIPYETYDLVVYLNHDRGTEDVLVSEANDAFEPFLGHENDPNILNPITFAQQRTSAQGDDSQTGNFFIGVSDPFGPFARGTRLKNSGETLTLVDPFGAVVDEVSYSLGFPWPTVGDDRGTPPASPSIELINPLLDNDQGDRVVDEMVREVWAPEGPTLVGADRRLWDNHPRMNARDRYYDVSPTRDFEGMIGLVKNYLRSRGNWMTSNLLTTEGSIPATPVISGDGSTLTFTSPGYRSPVGSDFGALEWRLSEISNAGVPGFDPSGPYRYEIEDPYQSAVLSSATPPSLPLVVIGGDSSRGRVAEDFFCLPERML